MFLISILFCYPALIPILLVLALYFYEQNSDAIIVYVMVMLRYSRSSRIVKVLYCRQSSILCVNKN